MADAGAVPEKQPDLDSPPPVSVPPALAVELQYTKTAGFVSVLNQLRLSLLVSTYQANKLLAVRATPDGLSLQVRNFEKPMGLALDPAGSTLAVCGRSQIWRLRSAPDLAAKLEPPGLHDACYLPRSCHVTGNIAGHEVAWAGGELWIVNTRFSCLCTLHYDFSFVPRWLPPFVTALVPEFRCHLNGLAVVDGRPKYVTALGETNTEGGWRPNKDHGGCLVDVPSGAVVARGLSMPHSPRVHGGRLLLLESGTGGLVRVDPATGRWETIVELPGFTRGLGLYGSYAFVGLSKIRETSTFGGLPISQRLKDLKCGIAVVNLDRGQVEGLLEFQTVVEEIFDVLVLPGLCFPEIVGFQKETIQHLFVLPLQR